MTQLPVIPGLFDAVIHLMQMGLDFGRGKIYIFNSQKSVDRAFDLENKGGLSILGKDAKALPATLMAELFDQAVNHLKQKSPEKNNPAFAEISGLKDQEKQKTVAIPSDLSGGAVMLAIFSGIKPESYTGISEQVTNFAIILKHAINAYLQYEKIRGLEFEILASRQESILKTRLLSLSLALATVKSFDELAAIIDNEISDQNLLGEFFILQADQDSRMGMRYIHSTKNLALFENYLGIDPGSENNSFERELIKNTFASRGHLTISLEDIKDVQGFPAYMTFWKERGMKRLCALPLTKGKEQIAVLSKFLDHRRQPTDREIQLLKELGRLLAVALENIQTYETTRLQLAELGQNKKQLEVEKLYLQEEIGSVMHQSEITGTSDLVREVNLLIEKVAPSNSNVLVLGETGTGKELAAREIHNASGRRDKIMIKVNCAAILPNLIESELFGHERGSFTGASERHIGKFELAHNSTLFLDEVGDMPYDLQVKVLRAIQEKEIERVGGKGVIKVNVRIIAATNRNLQKEISEGKFRSDLFYRLNVFPITLPPLRDRKEDIPALTMQFIAKFARAAGKTIDGVSDKVLRSLMDYEWPGNVRELEHLMERSVLLCKGNLITQVDIPFLNRKLKRVTDNDEIKTMEEMEREHILFALKKANGKVFGKGGAADLLGMHYSTLNSRITKLGIQKGVIVRKRT